MRYLDNKNLLVNQFMMFVLLYFDMYQQHIHFTNSVLLYSEMILQDNLLMNFVLLYFDRSQQDNQCMKSARLRLDMFLKDNQFMSFDLLCFDSFQQDNQFTKSVLLYFDMSQHHNLYNLYFQCLKHIMIISLTWSVCSNRTFRANCTTT